MRCIGAIAVMTAIACAGCTHTSPLVVVGGAGIRACITNPRSGTYAVIVPVQNFSDSTVVIDAIRPSSIDSGTFVESRIVSQRTDGSEPALANASVGLVADIAGFEDARDVTGTELPAGAQIKVAVAVHPDDAQSTIAGVTAEFEGAVARSTVIVVSDPTTCEGD